MTKFLIYLLLFLFSSVLSSQNKYFTKTGNIVFKASVPSFEEVKATNNTVTSIFNIRTGEIAALALVKAFRFKVALMEEHFNENYAETYKFPKTTFTGVINDFSFETLTENNQKYKLSGKLTFHGKTVKINSISNISQKNDTIFITTKFIVKPEDFDIKIPKLVRKKVADTVTTEIKFKLTPKK